MMNLKENEIRVIAEAVAKQKEDFKYSKAGQHKDQSQAYTLFDKTSIGRVFKEMPLKGVTAGIYGEIKNYVPNPFETETIPFGSLDEVVTTLTDDFKAVKIAKTFEEYLGEFGYKEVSCKELSPAVFSDFEPMFEDYFGMYGSHVMKISIVTKANTVGDIVKELRVTFAHKEQKVYSLDFPYINKDGFFEINSNVYSFANVLVNIKELIAGDTTEPEILHPYSWLSLQLLKAYDEEGESKFYSQDIFDNIIFRGTFKEYNATLQRKLAKLLNNSKNNPWDESITTPIMWYDSQLSSVAKELLSHNVLIDSCYKELAELGLIKGLDLLSGSTSTPAKRVIPAHNYELQRIGSKIKLVKVRNSNDIVGDYAGNYKTCYPAFVKTSAKRDNTSTIKDTVNLVNPQRYIRKFIIK